MEVSGLACPLYFEPFRVFEFPETDDDKIDHRPDSEAAYGEQLKNSGAVSSGVESMSAEDAEKERKGGRQYPVFVAARVHADDTKDVFLIKRLQNESALREMSCGSRPITECGSFTSIHRALLAMVV